MLCDTVTRRTSARRLWRLSAAIWLTIAAGACWAGPDNDRCLMCHSAPGFSRTQGTGQTTSRRIDIAKYAASVHGGKACVDCHVNLAGAPLPHPSETAPVDCTSCHRQGNGKGAPSKEAAQYADSVHGRAVARRDPDAPRCADCHGSHYVRRAADPKSPIFRLNIPRMCGACHSDPALVKRHNIPKGQVLKFYQASIHGQALARQGLVVAAVCTDCHGVHTIQAGSDAMSPTNRAHIPDTCGQCHAGILAEYRQSVHGQAWAAREREAPICTDCHGEHSIRAPREPGSTVSPLHVAKTCSHCHEDVAIQRRYGLPAERLASYIESYHGVANKFGQTTVANCATCHGAHNILPSANPGSSVNKANLPKTCGQCHPGAGVNFAKGSVHVQPSPTHDVGVFWVRTFYKVFIATLITAFCLYIALDLITRARRRLR